MTTATAVKSKKFAYYPGCSLQSSAAEYDHSTRAVFEKLGLELAEIPDWNCCGASSAHALDHTLALALPLRNLALAEAMGADVAIPCAACFSRLKTAERKFKDDEAIRSKLNSVVEEKYRGEVTARHSLDIVFNDVGLKAIKEKVIQPLKGLPVVCYYGCLLVRPPKVVEGENPDNPMSMDRLMEALGASPRDWPMKTDCCGAGHALARTDIVEVLSDKLVAMARRVGAKAIVAACPMCHANLDMRQREVVTNPGVAMPVYFYTELMAVAMGVPGAEGWLSKHIVPAVSLLQQQGIKV